MIEPLNHIKTSPWPEWHNKPLKLTLHEIENPSTVIENFFHCYHLPDIRVCLQTWLQDALTKNTIESKQHISTHTEVEKLVEAIWVLNHGSKVELFKPKPSILRTLACATTHDKSTSSNDKYTKEDHFVHKVFKNPTTAMQEAFSDLPIDDLLSHLLPNWLRIALLNDACEYSDGGAARQILDEFYDQLLVLIQALFIINQNSQSANRAPINAQEWQEKYWRCNVPSLSDDQVADPGMVIAAFYEQYPIDYVRRELRDFLYAGVGYDGRYPNDFTPRMVLMTYEYVLCYTEATYHLYQQMKTNVQNQ